MPPFFRLNFDLNFAERAGIGSACGKDGNPPAGIARCSLKFALIGDAKGTKQEMAEMLAQKYPCELAGKLPPKRRSRENEDGRMDAFDAVGPALVFRMLQNIGN